jgi:acyl transferase domain-containing protein
MERKMVAVLFPGQGAFYPGALANCRAAFPCIEKTFEDVDRISLSRFSRRVSDVLWGDQAQTLDELLHHAPELLQLATYGISVATYKVLESNGVAPDVLAGHSFGEIAALACANAISVADGAVIVSTQVSALSKVETRGYMAAVSSNAAYARMMVELVGNKQVVVAAENYSRQTVLSGAVDQMDKLSAISNILGLRFVRLRSLHAFQSPLMQSAVAEFKKAITGTEFRSCQRPVYSPILGRHYRADDNFVEALASHLTRPVRFAKAIDTLYRAGVTTFLECGALDTLSKLTRKILKDHPSDVVPCAPRASAEQRCLQEAIDTATMPRLMTPGSGAGQLIDGDFVRSESD